jgi:hypothetical protein
VREWQHKYQVLAGALQAFKVALDALPGCDMHAAAGELDGEKLRNARSGVHQVVYGAIY